MSPRAVFVSDLHLTTNPRLDDFMRDDDFAELLRQPELQPGGDGVDLVLLGDTFDLWQSVGDAEAGASKAKDIPLAYAGPSQAKLVEELRQRHGRWFEALGSYLRQWEDARVFFVPGNHDRTLEYPEVQDALVEALRPKKAAQLSFRPCYERADLGLYADHGSQYDTNNDVGAYEKLDPADDSAGYYFVKLFFNRLEHRDPRIENSPSGWAGIWHWLRRAVNFALVAAAIRWFWQYWNDGRVPRRIGPARAAGLAARVPNRVVNPSAPVLLVSGTATRARGASFFSEDPEMEEFFREAYEKSEDVRIAVNEILEARRGPARRRAPTRRARPSTADRRAALARRRREVPRPTTSRPVPAAQTRAAGGPPSDVQWAERLFTNKPAFRAQPLTRPAFELVIFGHTHGELTAKLSNGAMYLNTGSWTSEKGPLPVVVAEMKAGARTARLVHLADGRLQ